MKIVLNRSVSIFRLSNIAIEMICAAKGNVLAKDDWPHAAQPRHSMSRPVSSGSMVLARTDKDLIDVVERLGQDAGAEGSELEVIEIPDGIEWTIGDVYGIEYVRAGEQRWPRTKVA